MGLLNEQFITDFITAEEKFHTSHSALGSFLGGGIVCYAFPYMIKAKTAICLGSGSGFIPRLMRQAQRDCGIEKESKTILIDANLPDAGWGVPDYFNTESFFLKNFDVIVIQQRTDIAIQQLIKEEVQIDYIHIDADHSYAAVKQDFENYRPLMSSRSIMTFHDTRETGHNAGVWKFIRELRGCRDLDVIDLHIGTGLGVVRVRTPDEIAADGLV